MKNSVMGLCIALVIALLIGCAHPHHHRVKVIKPAKPTPAAVWVPGHYGPRGKWIPGHWRR